MTTPRIAIVNYNAGNLRSVQKALERFGSDTFITDDPGEILNAEALVFPGQGANDASMQNLNSKGLIDPIKDFIASDKPFLGICLGLQLLFEGSDEGTEPGLRVLDGWVRRLPIGQKVPHMGWNRVNLVDTHPVFAGIDNDSYFYFVHSYYADPEDLGFVIGTTHYGIRFCSVAAWANAIAVQFHPEKSGEVGLKVYKNFVKLIGAKQGHL